MESKEKTVDIKASSEGLLKEIEALRLQSLALTEENKQKDKKIELLEEKQADYEKTIEAQKKRIADLWEQLAKRYKKTTEVYHDPNQPLLFNELELEVTNAALNDDTTPKTGDPDEDLKTTVRSYVRHKSKNTILTLPADTPVTDIYIDNGPKKCSACGSEMVKDGERVYEAVTKTVTYAIVRKHYTLYKCPNCEGNEEDRKPGVPKGDMLAGTVVDPTLLADVVVSKFDMGSTLYRIERELRYRGVPIPRESISAWLMRCGNAMLGNLDEVLKMEIFKYPLINVDETPTKVLKLLDENGEKKAPNSKYNGFMVSITGIDKDGKRGLTILIFTDNRRNETIRSLLEGYNGCVQTDGLEGYNYASEEIGFDHLGCLAHARRKAVEAMGSRKSGIAYEMVKKYRKIFHVESQWNEKRGTISPEEFVAGRKAEMLPLFEDLKTFCEEKIKSSIETRVALAPRTAVAVNYYLKNYKQLIRFLDYPFATSSNQTAEQTIRKYVIDRNAGLFNITECGANVSALYFSLVQSCRHLGINPIDYFTHLFLNGGDIKNGDVEGWTAILPGKCNVEDAVTHRNSIANAKPDPNRTEPYILRGKKV